MLRLQNASLQKLQWYYYQLIRISLVQIDILRDLVPFVQFKKREKHPWRSATFTYFSQITHYTNGAISRNASMMVLFGKN